jgi:hypothetical protein
VADVKIVGNDPLVDGLRVALKLGCDGVVGDSVGRFLASHVVDGPEPAGWRSHMMFNEPRPLATLPCFDTQNVFALPSGIVRNGPEAP